MRLFEVDRLIKSKKADLSINVIVVAIIALLVLTLLVLIFTGKIGIFVRGTSDCPVTQANTLCTDVQGCNERGGAALSQYTCDKEDSSVVCCQLFGE